MSALPVRLKMRLIAERQRLLSPAVAVQIAEGDVQPLLQILDLAATSTPRLVSSSRAELMSETTRLQALVRARRRGEAPGPYCDLLAPQVGLRAYCSLVHLHPRCQTAGRWSRSLPRRCGCRPSRECRGLPLCLLYQTLSPPLEQPPPARSKTCSP